MNTVAQNYIASLLGGPEDGLILDESEERTFLPDLKDGPGVFIGVRQPEPSFTLILNLAVTYN